MPGRAPRTRFTSQMDDAIRARLQAASGRARRGEVRRAIVDAAAQLGLPPGAVLKRWYRLRSMGEPPGRRRRQGRPPGRAPDSAPASTPASPPVSEPAPSLASAAGRERQPSLAALLVAYQRALARTAACRAELALAETELSEAASRLALCLLDRPAP